MSDYDKPPLNLREWLAERDLEIVRLELDDTSGDMNFYYKQLSDAEVDSLHAEFEHDQLEEARRITLERLEEARKEQQG